MHSFNSPKIEHSVRTQETVERCAKTAEDVAEEPFENEISLQTVAPPQSPVAVDVRLTLDATYQEAFVRELESLLQNGEVSSFSTTGGQDSVLPHIIAKSTASVELDLLPVQPSAENPTATDQIDHGFFQSLLEPGELKQGSSSNMHEQGAAHTRPSPTQLDFSSSPAISSHESSLLLQEMQPSPMTFPVYPQSEYEAIRDYRTGRRFPNSYLDRIRRAVDPTISNDNWGDEHYFPESSCFRHIEDFRPDPHNRVDSHAISQGLNLAAMAVPLRTMEDSWKRFEESLGKRDSGESELELPPASFDEMTQRIQRCIAKSGGLPLPRDLEGRVQRQKISHSCRAMRGINAVALVAPDIHPFRIGTAPFVTNCLESNKPALNQSNATGCLEGARLHSKEGVAK